MFTQPLLVGLACLSLGALSSCSSSLSGTSIMSKSKSEAIVNGSSSSSSLPHPASANTIAKSRNLSKDKHGMPTYKNHSERTRYVRTTAYSHMENEVGAPGRMNASGGILKYGSVRSAAADWSVYPLGTKFRVKGQPHIYVVDDYGSALVGTNTIDIFKPSLRSMHHWGTRSTEITVVQWGSFERSARMLKGRTGYHHCRKMYYGCTHKLNSRVVSKDLKKNGAL
ncbi:MAG: 3D domain-containing protein [Akkermansiaceae bacterium]|jgi:3D (Asp-Asp-Asp) domain-containing protein